MKSKTQVRELYDLTEGWDIAREADKPIKASYDGRVYWFYPSGHIRQVKAHQFNGSSHDR